MISKEDLKVLPIATYGLLRGVAEYYVKPLFARKELGKAAGKTATKRVMANIQYFRSKEEHEQAN